jgi:thioredoxin reductase (NADPH)
MSQAVEPIDLLVVGAGPTGIAIGAEALQAGLSTLLVDQGPLAGNLVDFPVYMNFFTTRDLLEIAGIPFAIPHDKPNRREALAYYSSVARRYQLPLALHEEVEGVTPVEDGFVVRSSSRRGEHERSARAVALATGYFHNQRLLGVPGEDLDWVRHRYREPLPHYSERVVVIGGGNSACEAALELWRAGASVHLVHRGSEVKKTVKYWVKPDIENRIAEGAITASFESQVVGFGDRELTLREGGSERRVEADAAYVLIGYEPDVDFERRCGISVDARTLVPEFDPETCESNVAGLYVAGTLQAGHDTGKIFIENSRAHAPLIVGHLRRRLGR